MVPTSDPASSAVLPADVSTAESLSGDPGRPPKPKRPRLLVISCHYAPDSCGIAPMAADFAEGLAAVGWEVTARCNYPFYPEWKDKSGENGFRIRKSAGNGVAVERYGLFIPDKPRSLWQRGLQESTSLLSFARSLPRGRFDAVVVFCPLMSTAALGFLYKWFSRLPLMVCIQDIPAEAAAASGITSSKFTNRLFQGIQRTLLNRFDVWRSINQTMVDQLSPLRSRGQPLLLIPDWLHTGLEKAIRALPPKTGRGPQSPPKLFYSGNIGAKQGLLGFCEAIAADPLPFQFKINGAGSGAAAIRDWASAKGDSRFAVGGLTDEAGFVKALHDADLFVITEKPDGSASFFPSKSIPAMTVGTPVLAVSGPGSPLYHEVIDHKLGPWLPWENVGRIGGLLANLDNQSLTAWQQAALARSAFYNRVNCLNQFDQVLLSMTGPARKTVEA